MTLTKRELIATLNDRHGVSRKVASDHIEALIDLIKNTLENGENLKIAGFGNFEVKAKKARRGRNPQTGEAITLPPRRVITFKPSNILRDKINGVA